ncbi:MAG TPA: cobalamin-independent methionine synthase II family protein [Caulobacterales bacterium]|nr:cobalamin-independent methionine synthase II family protein [Caulobacterales bacterium]
MKRSVDRILTTHVGSLIRPKALLDAVAEDRKGGSHETYLSVLKSSVESIVQEQAEHGIDIVNDGEFGKSSWATYARERMTGFEARRDQVVPCDWLGRDRERFTEFLQETFPRGLTGLPADACVGPIAYSGKAIAERDAANLKAAAAKVKVEDVFQTAVAPASIDYDAINEYYTNERDYVYAIADALREEYQAIYKAGIVLQVDDAVLANMYDHLTKDDPSKYRKWAGLRVEALNHALEGIPADRVRYHICFGSWHVPHVADAPLEGFLDLMLSVNAGAYSIEAGNVRHEHEVEVWSRVKLPKDKILIPGVISHHTVTVEHPQLVANRLVQFAKYVGRENVIAGADCGFAQAEGIQRVHRQVMWAKFESLAEGARLATKTLWGR